MQPKPHFHSQNQAKISLNICLVKPTLWGPHFSADTILSCLKKTFHSIEGTVSSITLPTRQQLVATVAWGSRFDKIRSRLEPCEPLSKSSRIVWSSGKLEKLKKEIGVVEDLVNLLYHVASPVEYG